MAKIVVVDDSNADLKLMESILVGDSHTVTTLSNPVGAEEQIASQTPDLVLLDIVMPTRNGYEVLRGIKRNAVTKDVPVILVSSKSTDTDVRWGLRQGASEYVTKPYTAAQVLETISKVLSSKAVS
ncbi:response regulator [Deinococcus yavapaiensis]|uniref:Twitching motility two-component system response regulator PilH n=1 Tax=Deinococcus yavapaiensis KR-236 TaxID=694435 RepID=A0A318SB78_9DEIO|nr:response regulator [Deinococcus yavapaiensis]PYE56639.1 twitching motility two-component system response regulator PilH [Deinococcus yavapaiensis KR-236]